MSIVNQAVEDRISDGGVTDVGMPVFNGELAGNESGAGAVTIFDHFQEISSFEIV